VKGLCFIAFLDEFHEGIGIQVAVLEAITQKNSHVQVVWMDGPSNKRFSEYFDVADSLPQAVMFQRGTLRVKNFMGGFEEEQIQEFIETSISGKRIRTIERPVFENKPRQDL